MVQTATLQRQRIAIRVSGLVQGVGFRPHVYRLAQQHRLSGWVRNDGDGVLIQVQGERLSAFVDALSQRCPPLSRIERLIIQEIPAVEEPSGFKVGQSHSTANHTLLPPDTAICKDCRRELFDPGSPYYLFPFVNCAHCGPRYTIANKLPYDRCHTTMASFSMCPSCEAEYHSPEQRRFHAQPTACPRCGPRLSHSPEQIVRYIRAGKILAIKGLGGFHLVCDASNAQALQRLRQTKQRLAKPFAIMLANVASAKLVVELNQQAEKLLQSPQGPIVVLPRLQTSDYQLEELAPGLNKLGVMLPYTALHYLIFHEAAGRPDGVQWLDQRQSLMLVMSSANPNGEPLVIDNDEARQRLCGMADLIVSHDRDIVTPLDDTVVEVQDKVRFYRRARGYVPDAIQLPFKVPSILAVGGHLKNTVCLTRENKAFVSQHIGNLDTPASIDLFETTIDRMCDFLQVKPQIIAHDLHPEFYATRYAQRFGVQTEAVQHHHAHLAAVMAENQLRETCLGLVLDGYGMGDDGNAWGGELMLLNGAQCQRLAHLKPLPQPGGERAAREPWRMAASILHELGRNHEIMERFQDQPLSAEIAVLLEQNQYCPSSSSAGRLFDGVSGLLNICRHNSYEAEAAMRLQSLVTKTPVLEGGWEIKEDQLDLMPLLESLCNCNAIHGANLFHGTLIAALCDWVQVKASKHKTGTILLSGGCFSNTVLSLGVERGLSSMGFKVVTAKGLPVNDGGLSLGQAWVAAMRHGQHGSA